MTRPRLARRTEAIAPFFVMEILARAQALEAAGRDIVHMEVGEPDFPTPEPVVCAAQAALAAGHTRYTPAAGLPALRRAIADYYGRRFGVAVAPERIVVTPGSSVALQLAMAVLVDPGDAVLLCDPGYPCNRHLVRLVEGLAVPLPVGPQTRFQPTPAQVEAAWEDRTRALLVATPSNPTGTVVGPDELRALHATVRGRGGCLVVDEIYQELAYESAPHTALALEAEDVIVVNSFSKYFGMTGWRVGWLVAPPAWVGALDRLAQNLYIAAPTVAQHAAIAAFAPETTAILEARRRTFGERRDWLVPALERLGLRIAARPQGAFYVYADCSAFTDDSFALAGRLLEETGVAVTPGADFGTSQPERHLRFAYTTGLERLQEGVRRIGRFLDVAGPRFAANAPFPSGRRSHR
jgi:aspartate/methionine/tyrosine aminotransferase